MFSKACKYAIRAVFYLSVHSDTDQKLGAKEIAGALDVPKPYLAKILQQLARHNLISSSKGAGGGFFLNEKDREIRIRDVVECIDGEGIFSDCILGLPVCSSENPCPLHAKAMIYRKGLEEQLEQQSIEEFAKKIVKKKLTL